MIKGIHHISMKCASVGELERVKEFYIGLLGMKLKRQWDGGIMIDSGSGLIEVFIGDDGVRSKGAIRHTAFETDDVDGIAERIENAGYEVFIKPNDRATRCSSSPTTGSFPPTRSTVCEWRSVTDRSARK